MSGTGLLAEDATTIWTLYVSSRGLQPPERDKEGKQLAKKYKHHGLELTRIQGLDTSFMTLVRSLSSYDDFMFKAM